MPSAHAFVPTDTLFEPGRVLRPALRDWARRLLARLDGMVGGEPSEKWRDIAACMNQVALIEVFRGDFHAARELSELQLRWIADIIRADGLSRIGIFVPQPWINLGRLCRIERDYAGAFRHFALLVDDSLGGGGAAGRGGDEPFCFGPVVVDAHAWKELVAAKEMGDFLESAYVQESAKTYIAAKEYADAIEFARRLRPLVGRHSLPYLEELEVIALAKLERYREALAVTESPGWGKVSYQVLVRTTYRVALLACCTETEQARRLTAQLVERVLAMGLENAQDHRVMRYLLYLGGVARHVALDELAGRVWQQGLALSRRLDDVLLELAFLDALLDIDAQPERASLTREREVILNDFCYTTLLRARGLAVDPVAAADPVFEALRSRIEDEARGTAREAAGGASTRGPSELAAERLPEAVPSSSPPASS